MIKIWSKKKTFDFKQDFKTQTNELQNLKRVTFLIYIYIFLTFFILHFIQQVSILLKRNIVVFEIHNATAWLEYYYSQTEISV